MKVKELLIFGMKKILSHFDLGIVKIKNNNRTKRAKWIKEFLLKQSVENLQNILLAEDVSRSQLKQDLFVLSELNFKKNGFFVEFGASNGIDLSNTYLLETEFGWNGILSEPAKRFHKMLKEKRKCSIETNGVWSQSDKTLDFFEARDPFFSTLSDFVSSDSHKRVKRKVYKVGTISLRDMLRKHNAPRNIDYLSIDTEGSEFEILQSFDFDEYAIRIITVEHNHTEMRERIFDLLSKHNYVRKYAEISKCDDWYVKNDG